MDDAIVASPAGDVRALIARLILKPAAVERRLGEVILAPHQLDAVARIEAAFSEFGGALLCDVVGSGKTFIGLAVAAAAESVIIGPAALRDMWRDSMRKAQVTARYFSVESLSRGCPDIGPETILIVDEAHHFRNSATLRYGNLARIAAKRLVLLMSATPIHNSRADLESLAALFLGSRAKALCDSEIGRLIVRRDKRRVARSAAIPDVAGTCWLLVGDDPGIVEEILALPSPVPTRDAGEAKSLAAFGLLRQWASSEAALKAAIRRRLTRAAALESSLAAGEYPSEKELRAWIAGEDSVQLGLPGLSEIPASPDTRELLCALSAHRNALRGLAAHLPRDSTVDAQRANSLLGVAARHRRSMIVAFTSYEATAAALFRALAPNVRIAALTSRGGMVAGGRVSRSEIIRQFNPDCGPVAESDRIEFLITTDLLSEGVNLQNAEVVVHLDLPWTQARIDQRVGRLARVGSKHNRVIVYGMAPPPSADKALRMSAAIERKAGAAITTLGADDFAPPDALASRAQAPPEAQERLREIISGWLGPSEHGTDLRAIVAGAISSVHNGFVCVIEIAGEVVLLTSIDGSPSADPVEAEHACQFASGPDVELDPGLATAAVRTIEEWANDRQSRELAGLYPSAFLGARRGILSRIDLLSAETPLHHRARRADAIHTARQAAVAAHGHFEERELSSLSAHSASLESDAWLARVANVGVRQNHPGARTGFRIRALLLLVATTPLPSS